MISHQYSLVESYMLIFHEVNALVVRWIPPLEFFRLSLISLSNLHFLYGYKISGYKFSILYAVCSQLRERFKIKSFFFFRFYGALKQPFVELSLISELNLFFSL